MSTLRHSVCRRGGGSVSACLRVSVIIPLWGGGCGGRAGSSAGFAGRDGVGGAGTCARRGKRVGGRRLGGGGDSGRRGERNSRLGLVILHQRRGSQGLGI